ncbi:PX domain-containing protein [[Candida] zeylanoides]
MGSGSESRDPSFEEDNNPFVHTSGLTSMIEAVREGPPRGEEAAPPAPPTEGDDDDDLVYTRSQDTAEADTRLGGFNRIHIHYESRVTRLLRPQSRVRVHISEASNSNEGTSSSAKKYVAYTIKLVAVDRPGEDDVQTRRRYSDFESLRDILTRIFPLVIVPPIPPKNYNNLNVLNGLVSGTAAPHPNGAAPVADNASGGGGGDGGGSGGSSEGDGGEAAVLSAPANYYTYINSNHLSKRKLIEHRKRLLANFLNNCLAIPKLRNLEFFAKFLDPNANWTDEVALISSQLPRSVYQSNPENGLHTDVVYASLPSPVSSNIPSFLRPLRKAASGVASGVSTGGDEEDLSASIADPHGDALDSTALDEINKRIMENFIGLSADYTELGSVFNSFSLVLSEPFVSGKLEASASDAEVKLNLVFDKIGQAFDRSYITLNALVGDLETKFSEPLGEAVRFSGSVAAVRKFADRKHRQSALVDREVEEKRREYADLVRAEEESARIERAVSANGLSRNAKYDLAEPPAAAAAPVGAARGKFRMMPMIRKFTQYVSDIIDQNPEETRKQKLVALQQRVGVLEQCRTRMAEDLAYISDELHSNLRSFERFQLRTIYKILLCYNGFLVEWAQRNVEIWEEIRAEVAAL